MTREELIGYCRYYKGEEENPYEEGYSDNRLYWWYEMKWVMSKLSKEGRRLLLCYVYDYSIAGLSMFSTNDGTPISLKALLFNRYEHWLGYDIFEDAKSFKKIYIEDYIQNGKNMVYPSSTEHLDDEMSQLDMHILGVYGAIQNGLSIEEALMEYQLSEQIYNENISRCREIGAEESI